MRHTWSRPKIMIYLSEITGSKGSVNALKLSTKCCKQGQSLKRKLMAFIRFSSFWDPKTVKRNY